MEIIHSIKLPNTIFKRFPVKFFTEFDDNSSKLEKLIIDLHSGSKKG